MKNQSPPYDPRAVANEIIQKSADYGYDVSNLALQKLLYFTHAFCLFENNGNSLIKGHFEAWQFGPVHPSVYEVFKVYGSQPITSPAKSFDYSKNILVDIPQLNDPLLNRILSRVVDQLGGMKPSQLVNLTHAEGGPWDVTVNKAKTSVAIGMRISDSDTKNHFGKMKLDLSILEDTEFNENSPFA